MSPSAPAMQGRAAISERLEGRRAELEQAVLARLHGVAGLPAGLDLEYTEGLRAAVRAAIDFALAGLECGVGHPHPVPIELLSQVRLAARNGVSLDTVLRRYFAGYALLGDFLLEEAERDGCLQGAELQRLMREQATRFDRLIAAIGDEHACEANGNFDSIEQKLAEHVRGLLAGELIGTAELSYDFDAHHLGVIAAGSGAEEAIRALGRTLDRRVLLVDDGPGTIWAWLGGSRQVDPHFEHVVSRSWPPQIHLAIGEPAEGVDGWRLTHQQARAAWPIALRRPKRIVRYSDVALLAAMLRDEVLVRSVNQLYLSPLSADRDGGAALRQTLRAYFEAERNVSSAAAALGVSRQTVVNRLRSIEERLDRPLKHCAVEVEAALRLDELSPTPLQRVKSAL